MEGFFHLLRLTLRNADKANLPTLVKPIFAFFLDVFDLRHRLQKRGIDQDVSLRLPVVGPSLIVQVVNGIEESAIGSFLELVIKLNEVTFKPLFVRLYDWAVIDLSEGASELFISVVELPY
jgi:U3 small nucleolar RNA-associated protein 10